MEILTPGRLWYIASPYSLYEDGIEAAAADVARVAADLAALGVSAISPIIHSHTIAMSSGLDPLDGPFWLRLDKPLMDASHGLIVAMLRGWQDSEGVTHEIAAFEQVGKPIYYYEVRR